MSIDSGPEESTDRYHMSPGLRAHIIEAAEKIRADHHAECADVTKADRAARLFRSIICPNGLQEASAASGQGLESLAAGFGALLGNAVRTGTELMAIPVAVLAEEWMASVLDPGSKPNPVLATTAVTPEEARLRDAFRRFMPMVVFTLNQGGTGYSLAEKVIALLGRPTYDQACAIGKDRIMAILKSERDVWDQVAPIEDKFSRFLDEFLGYDLFVESNSKH